MFTEIRVPFFGQEETLTVEYKENSDPREAGFHLLNLPFPIEDSVGQVCSEFVMCYPPGIPILAPGERITRSILDYILYAKEKGCSMTGSEDPDINNLNVLI